MTEETKRVLELLPMANKEEIRVLGKVLYQTIQVLETLIESKESSIAYLKQRVTELESDESPLLKSKEELIKSKDDRIAFLEEWLKDKDQKIERLRLQVQTNEFNRLFVFGKVGMGKA